MLNQRFVSRVVIGYKQYSLHKRFFCVPARTSAPTVSTPPIDLPNPKDPNIYMIFANVEQTNKRIDDLKGDMVRSFDKTEASFVRLESSIQELRQSSKDLDKKIDTSIKDLDKKIDTSIKDLDTKVTTSIKELDAEVRKLGKDVAKIYGSISFLAWVLPLLLGGIGAAEVWKWWSTLPPQK